MNHRPRKRFGQNFLHDQNVIRKIVDAIRPREGERIVEIGPGQGALTAPLLEALGKLEVVELDRDLIPHLESRFNNQGELTIHQGDALKFDFCQLSDGERSLRLVGNLPYNISTPLLFHLLEQSACIIDMHFMLQKEVVERMVALPGEEAYGRLGIMLQYFCEAEHLFNVGPGAFNPPPKVDSAIVRLIPRDKPAVEVDDFSTFAWLVRHAFTQRRKTLRNILKGKLEAEAIEALGIDPAIRPERLGLAEFARLANTITAQS